MVKQKAQVGESSGIQVTSHLHNWSCKYRASLLIKSFHKEWPVSYFLGILSAPPICTHQHALLLHYVPSTPEYSLRTPGRTDKPQICSTTGNESSVNLSDGREWDKPKGKVEELHHLKLITETDIPNSEHSAKWFRNLGS